MLPNRDAFVPTAVEGLAICGCYIPARDSVHVGIFFHVEGRKKIVEFNATNNILFSDAMLDRFGVFYFSQINNFPQYSFPLFAALTELVAQNKLNSLRLNIANAVYDGGKFDIVTGNHINKSSVEQFINCAVFALSLLRSFEDYALVRWEEFPVPVPGQRDYLDDWLNSNNIPADQRDLYYNQARVIRGKHILVSPLTGSHPSEYHEVEPLAQQLIDFLQNTIAPIAVASSLIF